MTRKTKGWTWQVLCGVSVSAALLLTQTGCPECDLNKPPEVIDCDEPMTPFEKLGCWVQSDLRFTPAVPPGSNYEPGSIISVNGDGQIIVNASKSDCFQDVVLDEPTSDSFTYTYTLKKDSSLKLDVQLGDFFKQLIGSTPTVTLKSTDVSSIDIQLQTLDRRRTTQIRLHEAYNAMEANSLCREYLNKPDAFVVVEGAALKSFKLVFRDEQGRDLTVNGAKASDLLNLDTEGKTSLDSQGSVVIEQPVFVGFRLVRLPERQANACCDANGSLICFTEGEQSPDDSCNESCSCPNPYGGLVPRQGWTCLK